MILFLAQAQTYHFVSTTKRIKMYIKYVTTTTASINGVVSDLAALCTGASISSLSSSCDKDASQILVNTDPAGWTMLDSAGTSGSKVLTTKDASNTDKFIAFFPNGTSSFYTNIYDTYNVGTHTGTGGSSVSTVPVAFTTGQARTYFILVNQKIIYICDNQGLESCGSLEFSRDADFLSNTSYPAHVNIGYSTGIGGTFSLSKFKRQNSTGDATSAANGAAPFSISATVGSALLPAPLRTSVDSLYLPMLQMYIGGGLGVTALANMPLGKVDNVFITSGSYGNPLDTVTEGSDTYLVITFGAASRFLVKLG